MSSFVTAFAGVALGVANGIPDNTHIYTVKISVQDGKGSCSGTFLNPNTMMTAAHCVASFNRDGSLRSDGGIAINGVRPLNIYYYGDFFPKVDELHDDDQEWSEEEAQDPNFGHDLVLAIFPENTGDQLGLARDGYPTLAKTHLKRNDGVIFVGYGMLDITNHDSAGIRRTGTNVLAGIFDNLYYVQGLAMPDRVRMGAVLEALRGGYVRIAQVASGSPADQSGLEEGHIILSINNTSVHSPAEVVRALEASGPVASIRVSDEEGRNQSVKNVTLRNPVRPGLQANVLPGDSGGPLLNNASEIVGVASHIHVYRTGNKLTGAFVDVLSQDNLSLYRKAVWCEESDKCARYFRGSQAPSRLDLGATYEAAANGGGVTLTSVTASGPLAKAGLKAGDTVLAVNGVHVKSLEDLTFGLNMPDEHTTLTVHTADGQEGELTVVPTQARKPGNP